MEKMTDREYDILRFRNHIWARRHSPFYIKDASYDATDTHMVITLYTVNERQAQFIADLCGRRGCQVGAIGPIVPKPDGFKYQLTVAFKKHLKPDFAVISVDGLRVVVHDDEEELLTRKWKEYRVKSFKDEISAWKYISERRMINVIPIEFSKLNAL